MGFAWDGAVNDSRGSLWSGPPTGSGATFDGTGIIGGTTLAASPTVLTFGTATSTTTSHLVHGVLFFDANGSGDIEIFWTSATANNVSLVAQSRMLITRMEA